MLAKALERLPPASALPGGLVLQPKFDGYRTLVFTPWPGPGPVLIQSRRGHLIQGRFPDLAAAAEVLPAGWVLDGEVVVWAGEELSFESLQRRASAGGRTAARLAEALPAHFIAFDVLQADGVELLRRPYAERRATLEELFAGHGLAAPWTLCPETYDLATAQEWLTSWTRVPGVEGLVVKGRRQRYLPGARGWYKIRRRDTAEGVVGAVTGSLRRPQTLLLGRYDHERVLRLVARSTLLHPDAVREVGTRLTAARPGHPWEGTRFTTSWGSRTPLEVVLVEPDLVAEMDVDTAQGHGVWRHPARFARLRGDMAPDEVTGFDEGPGPGEGTEPGEG
ncbi:ATP-dependent DNA ligase [Streptomyces heilongjiangensis]